MGRQQIPIELRRTIGRSIGEAEAIAERYGVSRSAVYDARQFVAREDAGERYDEILRRWVRK